jgi:hypothetical protein
LLFCTPFGLPAGLPDTPLGNGLRFCSFAISHCIFIELSDKVSTALPSFGWIAKHITFML